MLSSEPKTGRDTLQVDESKGGRLLLTGGIRRTAHLLCSQRMDIATGAVRC